MIQIFAIAGFGSMMIGLLVWWVNGNKPDSQVTFTSFQSKAFLIFGTAMFFYGLFSSSETPKFNPETDDCVDVREGYDSEGWWAQCAFSRHYSFCIQFRLPCCAESKSFSDKCAQPGRVWINMSGNAVTNGCSSFTAPQTSLCPEQTTYESVTCECAKNTNAPCMAECFRCVPKVPDTTRGERR